MKKQLKSLTSVVSTAQTYKPVKVVQNPKKDISNLMFGGWDDTLFEGELSFHPVVRQSWWTLNLDKVLFDGKDTGFCDDENNKCQIIMDTGASLMATPPQVFLDFIKKIGGNSHCSNLSMYPKISFIIDGVEFFIDPFEYILSNKEDIDYLDKNSKVDCLVGFSVFDLGPNERVWIAGDIFLSKYYSVYDRQKNRVGLALAI